ncbi:MAG TPA: HWE histidine kinase domain-containing protein [Reyranellaceae bacterium]|nr:HWE histidine kinase domain-containing protein [Reyranellaceae bacterium]
MWRLVKREPEERKAPSVERAPRPADTIQVMSSALEQVPPVASPSLGRRVGGLHLATWLFLFGACLILPSLAFTGLLVEQHWRDQQSQIERRLEQVADDLAADIDRDLTLISATAMVLAGSADLAAGRLREFHAAAQAALHPLGLELLVRDLSGQQLLNTRLPWGTPLPLQPDLETDAMVRADLKPHVSNVVIGAVARRPVVDVAAPIVYGGDLRGYLLVSINPERLLAVMRGQNLPPHWNTGLSDRNGIIIARLLKHEEFVGKPLPPELRRQSLGQLSTFRSVNVEGVETWRAARISKVSGWLVSANVPAAVARQALISDLWSIVGLGIFLLLLLLALAATLGRVIAAPIRSIARSAVMVEHERIPPALRSPVREANEVSSALRLASERLQERTRALRQALERFNVALRGADIVVFAQDTERRLTWISDSAGYHRRDFLGRREEELLPPEARPGSIALKERAIATGQAQEAELAVALGGQTRHFRVRVEPVRDMRGDVIGLLGVSSEITALKESEQRNAFLVRELAHRSKNLLTVVQAIAGETMRTGKSTDDFMERFGQRMAALAQLQDLLVAGARGGVELGALVRSQLTPFAAVADAKSGAADHDARVTMQGPQVRLRPEAANAVGMALHELATNATKYGALSVPQGWVSIAWRFETGPMGSRRFRLGWREGGGPAVTAPERRGFGYSVITGVVASTLDAKVTMEFPASGALWQVDAPASIALD